MKFSEIILENRIDDFRNTYLRKYTPEQLKKIIDLIPQKFLMWVGKNFDSVNFNENFGQYSYLEDLDFSLKVNEKKKKKNFS